MWGTSFHTCRRVAAELLYLQHMPRLWWQWEGAPGWLNWGTPVLAACAPLSWTELLASLRAQPVVPRTCGSVLG